MKPYLILSLALFMAAMPALAGDCGRGCGFAYDELHSFTVQSPSGWCSSLEGKVCVFKPRDPNSGYIPRAVVSFSYILKADKPFDLFMADDLRNIRPTATSNTMGSIRTKQGNEVRIFQVTSEGSGESIFVGYLLQEGVAAVRFQVPCPQEKHADEARSIMKALASGYRSSL